MIFHRRDKKYNRNSSNANFHALFPFPPYTIDCWIFHFPMSWCIGRQVHVNGSPGYYFCVTSFVLIFLFQYIKVTFPHWLWKPFFLLKDSDMPPFSSTKKRRKEKYLWALRFSKLNVLLLPYYAAYKGMPL